MTRPAYPEARRSDDSDLLHGSVVADPYRWLEDADDPETVSLVAGAGRPAPVRARRPARPRPAGRAGGRAARCGHGRYAGLARRPAVLHAPHRRAGARRPAHRRPRRHRAGARRPGRGGPQRRHDAGRLAALQGGPPAGLPALGRRHRGVGAARHGRRDRRARRRRRSTARATPPSPGCPAARPSTTYAGSRRSSSPTARSSTTGGSGCTGSGPTRTTDVADLRRRAGQDQLLRRHGVDGRPVAGRSAPPPAPHRATTCGWPTCPTAGWRRPTLRVVQEGVDASTSLHVGRDGRVYVFTDRDAPRGRLARDDARATRRTRRGPTWSPEDDEAVLEGWAILDGPGPDGVDPEDGGTLLCSWTRHAMSEVTAHDLTHRRRARARCRCPASGRSPGWPSGPRAATRRGSATPTTSCRRRSTATTRTPGRPRCGPTAPGTVEVPEVHARQVEYASADGTTVRMLVLSPTKEPDQPRPDRALRVRRVQHPDDARVLRRAARLGGGRRRLRGRPACAAAPRRASSGTATGCARRSRTCSTTSTPRPSGWSPTAGRRRPSWRSPAAPTAGCSSARR